MEESRRPLQFKDRSLKTERLDNVGRRVLGRIAAHARDSLQPILPQLWRDWKIVMGEALSFVVPAGHKEQTLFVWAEDSMAMQEIIYSRDEILSRVNAYLGDGESFLDIKIIRGGAQKRLDVELPDFLKLEKLPLPSPVSGCFLNKMKPDDPIARCYRAFAMRKAGVQSPVQGREEDSALPLSSPVSSAAAPETNPKCVRKALE